MPIRRRRNAIILTLMSGTLLIGAGQGAAHAEGRSSQELKRVLANGLPNVCQGRLNVAPERGAKLLNREQFSGRRAQFRRVMWAGQQGEFFEVTRRRAQGRIITFLDIYDAQRRQKPRLRGVINGRCRIMGGQEIIYQQVEGKQAAFAVERLTPGLQRSGKRVFLNPPLPKGRSKECLRVGILDNGVNYMLPAIANRLARDKRGELVGFDVWENDKRPFDYGVPPGGRNPGISAFRPNHHGTMVTSVFLDYAPQSACVVPVRYPPFKKGNAVGEAIEYFRKAGVKIVSLQSARQAPWPEFERAMRNNPQMLFVAAAGNDGSDLTRQPKYPVVYDVPNLLVVGGLNQQGGFWRRSNEGAGIVDIAVLAEKVPVTRFDGSSAALSGTSFAAPKVAGFAARLLKENPNMSGSQLHDTIVDAARKSGTLSGTIPHLPEDDLL